ncbi:glycosyltransferase family 2 protein [Desulfosediminicola flagellatus]|uniref:glycosyltransferase family 2 protein n=1 Tax=Desulfosediminicola flagellatus TaxID=2569541 RepID=UPI0010ABA283|nr:glycosyltransferase family 2 protein [Desulfosediminicola flagellatus]
MLISFVIPAWNASTTISRTLDSIYCEQWPESLEVETVIVDDGSEDCSELRQCLSEYSGTMLVEHGKNQGICAARNSGISASQGEIVIILDADDELVAGWSGVLQEVVTEWPGDVNVCYAVCINSTGRPTVTDPEFKGFLTLDDILNERHSGEYIPLFRGEYVRNKSYVDLNMRKSCGIVSYINFAIDRPFWVSNHVLRIYHDNRKGSVTSGWLSPGKAAETLECYEILLQKYENLYREHAPGVYQSKLLRMAVYRKMAGVPGAWKKWFEGASLKVVKDTLGAALVLIMGRRLGGSFISAAKSRGVIRRYG